MKKIKSVTEVGRLTWTCMCCGSGCDRVKGESMPELCPLCHSVDFIKSTHYKIKGWKLIK